MDDFYETHAVGCRGNRLDVHGCDGPAIEARRETCREPHPEGEAELHRAGTVDEKHKIFLFVFDSPGFMQGGSMPIGFGSTSAKDGTVAVSDLSVSPIYIAVCYDPTGGYDGQSGPPPSGASMGIYAKTPGTPEPVKIEPGKTAEVTVPFDDSFKMP